jgi:hypothetical protein
MRSLLALAGSVPLALVLLGCTQQVSASGEATDAEAGASMTAVIGIERTSAGGEPATSETVARFVRMHGPASSDEALRAVGAMVEFPQLGGCIAFGTPQSAPAAQLVDVGAVSLEANGLDTRLIARQLPDVGDVVTGVGYGRTAAPGAFPARTRYVLHVSGSPEFDLAPFEVAAAAPADLELTIAGQEARGTVVLTQGEPLLLAWNAGAPDDMVYVDLAPRQATATTPTMRCAFADTGGATIASSLLPGPDGTLRIHRLHREAFAAHGIDAGEMRFDFAQIAGFVVVPRAEGQSLR